MATRSDIPGTPPPPQYNTDDAAPFGVPPVTALTSVAIICTLEQELAALRSLQKRKKQEIRNIGKALRTHMQILRRHHLPRAIHQGQVRCNEFYNSADEYVFYLPSFPFSSEVIEGKLTPLDKVKQTILPAARAIEDAWDRKVKPAVHSVVSL